MIWSATYPQAGWPAMIRRPACSTTTGIWLTNWAQYPRPRPPTRRLGLPRRRQHRVPDHRLRSPLAPNRSARAGERQARLRVFAGGKVYGRQYGQSDNWLVLTRVRPVGRRPKFTPTADRFGSQGPYQQAFGRSPRAFDFWRSPPSRSDQSERRSVRVPERRRARDGRRRRAQRNGLRRECVSDALFQL